MCFVNCHLAAHVEEFQRRNQDFRQIWERMIFACPDGTHKYIKDHEYVHNAMKNRIFVVFTDVLGFFSQIFWFGDMNYRIDPKLMPEKVKQYIEKEHFEPILSEDQLKMQMKLGHVFPGFCEGPIKFRPTYKYDPGRLKI